jgi:hypothetical protein
MGVPDFANNLNALSHSEDNKHIRINNRLMDNTNNSDMQDYDGRYYEPSQFE